MLKSGQTVDSSWLSTSSNQPGWEADGPIELLHVDGTIFYGTIEIEDFIWTGEETIPIIAVTANDGSKLDFFSFTAWRYSPNSKNGKRFSGSI